MCEFGPGIGRIITVKYRKRRGGPSKHETIREAGPSKYLRDFLRDHRSYGWKNEDCNEGSGDHVENSIKYIRYQVIYELGMVRLNPLSVELYSVSVN